MNKEIIILVGISGSGKSTWTTNFIKKNTNHLRINRDDIRKTLVGNLDTYYYRADLPQIESIINDVEDNLFHFIWGKNKYPIVDNTNLKEKYINNWIRKVNTYNSARATGAYPDSPILDFKFKLFDCDPSDAQRRVCKRESLHNFEGLEYITKQHEDYLNIKEYLLTHYKDKIML